MGIIAVFALIVCGSVSGKHYNCLIEDTFYTVEECQMKADLTSELKGLHAYCLEISDTDRG